jgi:hypothetical protein
VLSYAGSFLSSVLVVYFLFFHVFCFCIISLGSRRGVIDVAVDAGRGASLVASPERSAVPLSILPVVELG